MLKPRTRAPRLRSKEWTTGYKGAYATWLGQLFRDDPADGRKQLERILRRHRGIVKHAARDLGVTRRWVFYLLWRENLWPVLEAIRAERVREARKRKVEGPAWLAGAREALSRTGEPRHDGERELSRPPARGGRPFRP